MRKRHLLLVSLVACLLGIAAGVQLANAAPKNKKICGGEPDPADPTKRTNNGNCKKACAFGCVFGDDKFMVCEAKDNEHCVDKHTVTLNDYKKCTGELWDVPDCKAPGKIVGTCQNNKPYCG